MRVVDFGFDITKVPEEVSVGFNHFIVRYDSKVYVWGCYNSDSEDRIHWKPTEFTFFQQYKVKAIVSGQDCTAALVE